MILSCLLSRKHMLLRIEKFQAPADIGQAYAPVFGGKFFVEGVGDVQDQGFLLYFHDDTHLVAFCALAVLEGIFYQRQHEHRGNLQTLYGLGQFTGQRP